MLISEVELDPQRTFCPQPGCDTVCNINNQIVVGDQSFSQKVSCPTVSKVVWQCNI